MPTIFSKLALTSIGALVLVAVAGLAQAAGTARADVPPDQVQAVLRTAIKAEVERQGKSYAGLCREIDQAASLGKACAFVQTLSATSAEVTYGPVASDEITRVTFERRASGWTVAGQRATPTPYDDIQPPTALRAAIKALVEGKGHQYAGLCLEIDQPANVGKWCAFVQQPTPERAIVRYGAVLSDDIQTATFVLRAGAWVVEGSSTPATPTSQPPTATPSAPITPRPPVTGNGGDEDGTAMWVIIGLVAAGAGLAGAGAMAAVRRR